jgi:HEAT repeat protein
MTDNLESMFNAPDDEIRREAALYLRNHAGAVETEKAIGMLVHALMDPSWRVRKTAVDILVEAYSADAYFDSIVSLLYQSDNAGARNSAIEVFVKVGPRSAGKLSEAFRTNDVDVRKFIIDIAGEIAHRSMVPLLTSALKDNDENVKAAAVEHLGSLKEPLVVDALLEILSEGDLWTSYPAIEALGRIGDLKALPYLVDTLSDKMLREPALRALGSLGGEKVVRHIVPYLTDKSRAVRQVAYSSLEEVYEKGVSGDTIRAEIEECHGAEGGELLLDMAASDNKVLRVSALMLLGVMGDTRAIEPLLMAASEGVNEELIVRSLVHIGTREPQALLQQLEQEITDPIVMRVIASALSAIARPEFSSALVGLLKDKDGHVRAIAAMGLGRLEGPVAIPHLLDVIFDKYEDVRRSVVTALVKLNAGLKPEVIQKFIKDGDPEVRKLAVPLLATADRSMADSAIAFLLKDPSYVVRKSAVDYFAENLDDENDTMLLHALTDESPDVRSAVSIRLGETRDTKYLQPLVLLLSDSEDMVRVSACKALGLMGSPEALMPLDSLLDDKNGFVVASSIESIARIGGPDALEMVASMLSSPDNEIRRTAIRSMASLESSSHRIIPYLKSDDWATRYEAAKALASHAGEALVRDSIKRAYEIEPDNVVREALKELFDA